MSQVTLSCALALLVSSILLSSVTCAPQAASKQTTSTTNPTSSSDDNNNNNNNKQTTTTQKPATSSNLLSERSNLAAPLKQSSPVELNNDDQYSSFDGKNPFNDDSLWQIPIHLVRDLSPSSSGIVQAESLSKSAREAKSLASGDNLVADEASLMNNNNDDQNDDDQSMSSAPPTIISASTNSADNSAASADLKTAAGYHHASPHYGGHHAGHHDYHGKYYQYASVPYPYAWEFGYRRGNPYHTIERHEHGKGPHFQTKVKWSDKHGGYGVHVWDYNHDDHHSHHYGGDDHHHGYQPSHASYGGHHGHHGYGHH